MENNLLEIENRIDVNPFNKSKSTPEQAADNINKAAEEGIEPDQYRDTRKVIEQTKPVNVNPKLAERMAQSEEHSKVLWEDLSLFERMENHFRYAGEMFDLDDQQRQLNDDIWRRDLLGEDTLSDPLDIEDRDFRITDTYMNIQNANARMREEFGLEWYESLPQTTVSALRSMGKGVWENADVAGPFILGAMGLGATIALPALAAGPAGIPAIAGSAVTGGKAGTILGGRVAMSFDAFKQTASSIYASALYDGGVSTPEAKQEAKYLALGAATLSAGLEFVQVGSIFKGVPWLKANMVPKKVLEQAGKVANKESTKTLIAIGKRMSESGGQEMLQSFIEMLSTTAAKDAEKGALSIPDVFGVTVKDPDFIGNMAESFVVGAAMERTITVGAKAVGKITGQKSESITQETDGPATPKVPDAEVNVETERIIHEQNYRAAAQSSVRLKVVVDRIADLMKSTKTFELLPGEIDSIVEDFARESGLSGIYMTKQDITSWVGNDEDKAGMIRDIITDKDMDAFELGAPIFIPLSDAVQMASRDDSISNLYRKDPEAPSTREWLKENKTGFAGFKIKNEESYKPTFKDSEIGKAKVETVKAVRDSAGENVSRVEDRNEVEMRVAQDEETLLNLGKGEEIDTVEAFLNPDLDGVELTDQQQKYSKQKRSVYTIDPKTLTKEQRKKFAKNPKIKDRKVLHKDGMSANDVATILGLDSVDTLLNHLATGDTRTEAVQKFAKASKNMTDDEASLTRRKRNLKLDEAFDKLSRVHLDEASKINEKAEVKVEVETLEYHQAEAQRRVGATQVLEVNPSVWKVGEAESQANARKNYEAGKAKAVVDKNKASQNAQLAKESHLAIAAINRVFKWVAYSNTKKNQNRLKRAGKKYEESMEFLKSMFKFEQMPASENAAKSFKKFVDDLKKNKNIDIDIPESVFEWAGDLSVPEEMTVDQLMYAKDLMALVLHEATTVNELFLNPTGGFDGQTREVVKDLIMEEMINHPDYNERKVKTESALNVKERSTFHKMMSSIRNPTAVLQDLNVGGKLTGTYKIIVDRMQGTGAFKGSNGFTARTKINAFFRNNFKKAVQAYGKKELDTLIFEYVDVPEFDGIPELGNGKISKADLLMMAANYGNLENRQRLTNYHSRLTDSTIFKVLERELTTAEMDLVQHGVWDAFVEKAQDIVDLEMETKQKDLELVKPVSFVFKGKRYKGGYFPISYIKKLSTEDITETENYSTNILDNYDGVVRSDHTKDRVGSDWKVDLSLDNIDIAFAKTAHDLAMRKPVADVMSLLSDKEVSTAMQSVMGTFDFSVLLDSIREQQHLTTDTELYKIQREASVRVMRAAESFISPAYIVWNLSSVMMNSLVIPEMLNRKGPKAARYLRRAFAKLGTKRRKEMYKFAIENDPDLAQEAEGMDLYTDRHILAGLLPEKPVNIKALGDEPQKGLTKIRDFTDANNKFWFKKVLGTIDNMSKVVNFNASYAQFMDGKVEGYPKSKLAEMTEEQRHKEAISWAVAINKTTTYTGGVFDKAPIQKVEAYKMFTRFFNDARNVVNNRIRNVKDIRRSGKDLVKYSREGDHVRAAAAFQDSGSKFLGMLTTIVVSSTMMDLIRVQFPFETEEEKEFGDYTFDDWTKGFGMSMKKLFTPMGLAKTVVVDGIAKNIPGLRDFLFALETGREVSAPVFGFATSVAKGVSLLIELKQNPDMANLSITEVWPELSKQEQRSLLSAMGAVFKTPVSGAMDVIDLMSMLDEVEISPEDLTHTLNSTKELMEEFVENNEGKPIQQELVNEIKEVLNTEKTTEKFELSDNDYQIIKYTESSGNWNARPIDRKTGKLLSSAFGYYQFLKGTWKDVVESPEGVEAGLTLSGLYSKNPEQQEIGMRIHSGWIADELSFQGVPVSVGAVYFGHHFGLPTLKKYAKALFTGKDSDPVPKSIVTEKNVTANSWLKGVKTIGQFKSKLNGLLKDGEKKLENARR